MRKERIGGSGTTVQSGVTGAPEGLAKYKTAVLWGVHEENEVTAEDKKIR